MKPAVSVIIPAYNPGAYLDEAVQSVLAQSFEDWELVVVDDGSATPVAGAWQSDPRVRLVRQPNRGLSVARNVGILSTASDYIAFLDADDLWHPGKLQRQLAVLQSDPKIGICHTAIEIIDERGAVRGPGFACRVDGYIGLLRGNTVCVSSVLARRTALAAGGLFDPFLRAVQDYDLWLKISRHYGLTFLDSVEVGYRAHSANMSGDPRLMAREVVQLLREHAGIAGRAHDRAALAACRRSIRGARLGWGCHAFNRARSHLRRREWLGASRELGTALRLAPFYTLGSVVRHPFRRGTVPAWYGSDRE